MKYLLIILTLLFSRISNAEDFKIKWGVIAPLSGAVARAGIDVQRGFEMALADLEKGHVQHELLFEDSQYKNRDAVAAAQRLFAKDVDIIVAMWETADSVAPLADKYNKLHASIRWNSDIADKFKNTFTFESTYEDYSNGFARLFKDLSLNKVAVLNSEDNGWNLALEAFKKAAIKEGITLTSVQSYLPTENDFNAYALLAVKNKPDVVLVNDIGDSLELITKTLRILNPKQRVTGYLDYPINLKLFEGEYFINQLGTNLDFAKRYEKKYGEPIYARAQLAYDMFSIISKTIDKFDKKPEIPLLVSKLKEFGSTKGMSGEISNTNNGKVFRTKCNRIQVVNGEKVLVK